MSARLRKAGQRRTKPRRRGAVPVAQPRALRATQIAGRGGGLYKSSLAMAPTVPEKVSVWTAHLEAAARAEYPARGSDQCTGPTGPEHGWVANYRDIVQAEHCSGVKVAENRLRRLYCIVHRPDRPARSNGGRRGVSRQKCGFRERSRACPRILQGCPSSVCIRICLTLMPKFVVLDRSFEPPLTFT
jgi:hypothetical protein